jgi:hypothetical protein
MRTLCAVVVGLVILLPSLVRAQESTPPTLRFINSTLEQTEKSLAQALSSNSLQLQATAALTAKELKALYPDYEFSGLVIPLMRIVKDEDITCQARVPAAIALHELHSARGDFAIERTALFTTCKHTQHICNWLTYYQYMEDHPELIVPSKPALTLGEEMVEPLPEFLVQ